MGQSHGGRRGGPGRRLSHSFSRHHRFDERRRDRPRDSSRLIDLNSAGEELLMTLPGVDRARARAIVAHRRALGGGGFRRVEDAALASGMGAERLAAIRADVTVAVGVDVAPIESPPLDVNEATPFDLQRRLGLDQRTAAAIVERRRRKGAYRTLDSLLKVRGVDRARLADMAPHLEAKPPSSPAPPSPPPPPPPPRDDAADLLELLAAFSRRPARDPELAARARDGRPIARVASWNLARLTAAKARNAGVLETVCLTILEAGADALAAQDVAEPRALEIVCAELNAPTVRRVADFRPNARRWRHRTAAIGASGTGVGFVYDESNVRIDEDAESPGGTDENENVAFDCARLNLAVGRSRIAVVNVLFPPENVDYCKTLLCDAVDRLSSAVDRTIVLGDFRSHEHVRDLASCYRSLVADDPEEDGGGGGGAILTAGDAGYAGHSGVVRTGLRHLAIPDGWTWGGAVSPHRPLWADFYVEV